MATLNTHALISLAEVREVLGFEENQIQDDDRLIGYVNRASARIETYTKRKFLVREYTEYHDGDGSNLVLVDQYPIVSVSAVWDDIDRLFTDNALLINSGNYVAEAEEGCLRLYNEEDAFQKGIQNIKVVYSGGYSETPDDIKQACLDMVVRTYLRYKDNLTGFNSKSAPGGNIGIQLEAMTPEVKLTLDLYKKWGTM
ncbi:MAG: phage head-tail connector protein [Gammaproteobacteria bacterium]|uniref:Putative head-tail connector n=1 Tax=viral metagenome TaxID=1070528 RepID=A0A6M3K374_9ZZZZ|nr:phage head-tail connector protein [Gammaproteobacteria bacterium]